jgi:tetratricopeptide (TPR) repeat protein
MFGLCLIFLGLAASSTAAEELFDTRAADEHFNRGLTLYFSQEYEGAIEEFEEVLKINPDAAKAYYFIGYSYYKLKEFPKANEAFDQAYQINSRYSPIRPTTP